MRKLISLGLLALLLSVLASPAVAGNVPDCEYLKDSEVKGLYGLCIAYHNASDESTKKRVLDNFDKKVKKAGLLEPLPKMPGLVELPQEPDPDPQDVTCPCLDALAAINNRDWGMTVMCTSDSAGGHDDGFFVDVEDHFTTMFSTFTDGVNSSCGILQSPTTNIVLNTSLQEYDVCLTELLTRCAQ
jgi:hypothetical protein